MAMDEQPPQSPWALLPWLLAWVDAKGPRRALVVAVTLSLMAVPIGVLVIILHYYLH